ncbi:MAG: EboA domain-containing protein, partial [Chryseosolibacter sp.]
MMFAYDFDRANAFLENLLQNNLTPEAWKWLATEGQSIRTTGEVSKFNIAFVSMPRKTGKNFITLSKEQARELKELRKDLVINGWTVDRLARVWLLMQLNPEPKEKYTAVIENLYLTAEMSELVALYSALPLLAYPESWRKRCAEGIRSNIGQVLEAILCNNPYPSEHLDEAAWNQLVLKAIFTEKPVLEIVGLRERSNRNLAQSLSDYAHERWAAHRPVNPLLWICVSAFIGQDNFSDIQRVFQSGDHAEQEAAALVCYESNYPPAKRLLDERPQIKRSVENGKVTWVT